MKIIGNLRGFVKGSIEVIDGIIKQRNIFVSKIIPSLYKTYGEETRVSFDVRSSEGKVFSFSMTISEWKQFSASVNAMIDNR